MNTSSVTIPTPIEPSRIPPRLNYRYDAFHNREDVLKDIAERIKLLQQGREIKNSLILAWGVQGVGKSWLLQHLEHKYRFIAPKNSSKGVFALYTDFRTFEPGPGAAARLLGGFVDSLQGRLSADIGFPHATVERFRKQQTTAVDDQVLAETFTNILEALSTRYVPLGLLDAFDTLQSADEKFFSWFEQWILAPWLQRDRSLVVLASRRELRQLRQFEVRRRLTRVPLAPFDRSATIKQLGGDVVAGTTLYPMTFGHPLTTWYVHEKLDARRKIDQPFDQAFVDTRRDDVANLLDQVIESLLQDAPSSLRPRIIAAATLRAFHIDSLREILASIEYNPDLSNESDVYIQAIIEEFVRSNLVRWSMQKRAYEVDDTVRRLVNRALELQNLEEYVYRHEMAYEVYRKRIADTPWSSNVDVFIVEAIYHLAEIVRAEPSRQRQVEERFEALLQHAFTRPPDTQRIDTLGHLLEGDKEIQELAPQFLIHLLENQFPRTQAA